MISKDQVIEHFHKWYKHHWLTFRVLQQESLTSWHQECCESSHYYLFCSSIHSGSAAFLCVWRSHDRVIDPKRSHVWPRLAMFQRPSTGMRWASWLLHQYRFQEASTPLFASLPHGSSPLRMDPQALLLQFFPLHHLPFIPRCRRRR